MLGVTVEPKKALERTQGSAKGLRCSLKTAGVTFEQSRTKNYEKYKIYTIYL